MEPPRGNPREVDEILADALSLPYAERWNLLNEACAKNPELRDQVEARLQPDLSPDAVFGPGAALAGPLWARFSAELVAETSVSAPDRIGPYRVNSEVGRGGMAVVYLAERSDGQVEQEVAVKLLTHGSGSAEAIQRFAQERQIVASFNHPAIAGLIDAGLNVASNFSVGVDGVSMDEIRKVFHSGMTGKIIDVMDEEDNEHVEIFIE